ncbi:MAG: 3-hydroxyacyl-ACP dehydratase FabZ family protein [Planctomycetota bacterium]|jgi:3-hydroxyacyl-[acyl-carrier-protein] dehydratase|nr:beta-hydroxyacyl-ACP dehydratase [Blastopirellula sp.]
MRFAQIDRILSLTPGDSVRAVKGLALSEEYLQDHFPRFPVMPGVLMLEAIFQAAACLVRTTDEFKHSMVSLVEARNLKFQGFVQPGDQLVVTAKWHSEQGSQVKLKVEGTIDDRTAVSGWILVEKYNLADRGAASTATDQYLVREFKRKYRLLFNPLVSTALPSANPATAPAN